MNSVQTGPRRLVLSVLSGLFVAAVVIVFFSKTVFLGQPISKIYELAFMDSLYHPEMKSWQITASIDPSIYLFRQPVSYLVESICRQWHMPLWDPFTGCGHPLLAMIESGVFNLPNHLFPASSQYLYNLGLVFRLAIAGLGTFLLSRQVGLGRLSSVYAGIAFALCPYIIREVELSKESWTFPWTLWLFLRLLAGGGFWQACLLGVYCGMICMTIHPECSLNSTAIGTLMALSAVFVAGDDRSRSQRLRAAGACLGRLALAAVVGFCVASPVLLPFLEFVRNSDCYKFGAVTPPRVPWQALLLVLLNPALGGSSPFLGIAAAPALAVSASCLRRSMLPIMISTVVAFSICTLVGPLLELFKQYPFYLLEPIYIQPLLFALLCVLVAYGLERLLDKEVGRKELVVFALSSVLVLAAPQAIAAAKVSFVGWDWDGGMPKLHIDFAAWRRDAVILIAVVILTIGRLRLPPGTRPLVALAILSLSIASQLSVSRQSLRTNPGFTFAAVDPLPWLRDRGQRIVGLGRHFYFANAAETQAIYDLRSFNGLYPAGYRDFISVCRASKLDSTLWFEGALPPAINLASVAYVVGRAPVYNTACVEALKRLPLSSLASYGPKLAVAKSSLSYDVENAQIVGLLSWQHDPSFSDSFAEQFVLLDQKGDELWSSEEFAFRLEGSKVGKIEHVAAWCVPTSVSPGTKIMPAVRVVYLGSSGPLYPESVALGQHRMNVFVDHLVATASPAPRETTAAQRALRKGSQFHLAVETGSGVRVYENLHALPQAYFVTGARASASKEESERLITSPSFQPWSEVAIEAALPSIQLADTVARKSTGCPAVVQRPDTNHVAIDVTAPSPGFVVLTDTFYPGWKASVDGRPTTIYRANLMFRAVRVPAGKHQIVFSFEPDSYKLGVALLSACLLVLVMIGGIGRFRERR